MDDSRYIVGIDFGTTFTSVAFCYSGSPDPKMIHQWPLSRSTQYVPTELSYRDQSRDSYAWGFESSKIPGVEPLKWFKLLLNEGSTARTLLPGHSLIPPSLMGLRSNSSSSSIDNLSSDVIEFNLSTHGSPDLDPSATTPMQQTARKLEELGVDPLKVVSDFLAVFRQWSIQQIERAYKKEWVELAKFQYILSVPAIWTDAAKASMVIAAESAGFGKHRRDFHLVSEPEAAAAHAFKNIYPQTLNVGDCLTVCDAGGGTVDLISYKVKSLDPLEVDEVCPGTGALCGSLFLNQRFEDYMRHLLGSSAVDAMRTKNKNEMMRSWEECLKVNFSENVEDVTSQELEVAVPGIPGDTLKCIEDGFHTMQYNEISKIFEPIITKIINLVYDQIKRVHDQGEKIKAVLLVGGFGMSTYLFQRLRTAVRIHGNISILQSPNARSAIARGALLKATDKHMIKSRRSRRHYGILYSSHTRSGVIGEGNHLCYHSALERWLVADRVQYYVNKDETIEESYTAFFSFVRHIPILVGSQPCMNFSDDLIACDLDEAPIYKWQNPSAIQIVCSVESDLSPIPFVLFPKNVNSNGQQYYIVEHDIIMTFKDEVLKLELSFNGTTYGEVVTNFEMD